MAVLNIVENADFIASRVDFQPLTQRRIEINVKIYYNQWRKFMVFDIFDKQFRDFLDDPQLFLPIRWNGESFSLTLDKLFHYYCGKLETLSFEKSLKVSLSRGYIDRIKRVCGLLRTAVDYYLNGFPSEAYITFGDAMDGLMRMPLDECIKNARENEDELELFRAVSVEDNKPYNRSRVFHTPYNLRSKVTTSRYSIAGYPSLYLGTSLELCCEEIHRNPYSNFTIASMFKLEKITEYTNTHIQIIELGIKPQDFVIAGNNDNRQRWIHTNTLNNNDVKAAYLLWYPLIASCSYIRINKKDPFAAEYIIPQLLMQWVRNEIKIKTNDEYDQLVGIRYFSCASVKSSDMGFNYVFPTSGNKMENSPFCSVLANVFRLTSPVYIHEFNSIDDC